MTKKLKYKIARCVTLLGDTHVGAQHAVHPQGFVRMISKLSELSSTEKSDPVALSAGQKELLNSFKHFAQKSKEYGSDTLILGGDLIAGMNPKECGRLMMYSEMDDQTNAFVLLITQHFQHIKNIHVIKGTKYHEAKFTEQLEKIALKLREAGFNATYMGPIKHLRFMKEPRVVVANIAHETTNATVYPETPMKRDIDTMLIQSHPKIDKVPYSKLIVRFHRHIWEHIDARGVHRIQVPCWQAYVPWDVKNYYAWQPDIGGVLLLIDEQGRVRVWEYTYPLPHFEDSLVEG